MNWKEFLMPDSKKAITFVILFALSCILSVVANISNFQYLSYNILLNNVTFSSDKLLLFPAEYYPGVPYFGFPFEFYNFLVYRCMGCTNSVYSLPSLFFDLIFWYFASCIIIFIYNKSKKKK